MNESRIRTTNHSNLPNVHRQRPTKKKSDEEPDEQITTTEAGKRLGVTPERIYQLIEEEKLPAKRFGKAWMIRASDLDLVRDRPKGRPRKKKSEDDEDE
jgi:excisionase family DNA binding protein